MVWLNKSIAVLFVTLFLVMVGFGIIIPIMPYLVVDRQGDSVSLGLLMACYSLMQFLFAPFWGRVSDRIGRRPVILVGLAGFGISFILFGLATKLWMLFAARILSGVISSATLPAAMAYIADVTPPAKRASSMGVLGAAMGSGMIFGPALGGWLGHYGYALPFFAAGGLALAAMPFAYVMLPESLALPRENERGQNGTGIRQALSSMMPLFLLSFAVSFSMALFEGTFTLFAYERFQFGPKDMGSMFAYLGITGIVVQTVFIGRLTKRFGSPRLVTAGMVMSAAGLLLIAFAPNGLSLILMITLLSTGGALMRPSLSALISHAAEDGQGSALGFMQSFDSLGRIFGPVAGGALYKLSPDTPYIAGFLLMVLILLASSRGLSRGRFA